MPLTDLADPTFKVDPFPFFARARAEARVARVRIGRKEAWLVSRYEDVEQLLRDERFAKDRSSIGDRSRRFDYWVPSALRPLLRNMLDLDEPDHRRLRSLVQKAFTPRRVDELHDRVRDIAGELLGPMMARGGGDLVADYALPLPSTVIAELLGVSAADRPRFQRWSMSIVSAEMSSLGMLRALPSVVAFVRFLRELIADRRRHDRDDLTTALVQAEEAGDRLTSDELVAMLFLLLVAGHETSAGLIANSAIALFDDPDAMNQIRSGGTDMSTAVEELLRFAGPLLTATERWAKTDIVLHGELIRRGDLVFAGLASANRDEERFEEADTLRLNRDPNPHLAFGKGIHYCLGAALARLEGQTALSVLLSRTRDVRLAVDREAIRWRRGPVLRAPVGLPVALDV